MANSNINTYFQVNRNLHLTIPWQPRSGNQYKTFSKKWESTTYRPVACGTVSLLHVLLYTGQDIATCSFNQNRLSCQLITTQHQTYINTCRFHFSYKNVIIWVSYAKTVVRVLTNSTLCVKSFTTILAWHIQIVTHNYYADCLLIINK